MGTQDEVWSQAYTQALLLWLSKHGYNPDTLAEDTWTQVMQHGREHALRIANAVTEDWVALKTGGSILHLLLDQNAAQILDALESFTELPVGDIIRNAIAVYDWIRQELNDAESISISREMCPHLAPRPSKPHLTLV